MTFCRKNKELCDLCATLDIRTNRTVMRLCEMCDLCDVLDIPPNRKEFFVHFNSLSL